MKISILGCGTSSGVPMIGKGWGKCDSLNLKNFRTRCCIAIETSKFHVLVDFGPDIKNQLIQYGRTDFDGVFVTHEHADHIHGIDDLRWVCMANNSSLKLYGRKRTLDVLKNRFPYAFTELPKGCKHYFKPVLEVIPIEESFLIKGERIETIEQSHGNISTLGYKYKNFAYCTDVVDFPNGLEGLQGIEYWIVDCLRKEHHNTHAHLDLVLEWVKEISPKKTYLTHMDLTMDYDTLCHELPRHIQPAYDGLILEV